MTQDLAFFGEFRVRRHFDKTKEKWFFSVIDIIAVLTDQPHHQRAKTYWTTLKSRLKAEGSEVVTICDRLKMKASDRKLRETGTTDLETIFFNLNPFLPLIE